MANGRAASPGAALPVRVLFLALWFAGALYAATHHTMWRDEIRAFSFAQRGSGLLDMVVAIRGDGHPALWHVILRLAWSAYRDPIVLPLAAFAIGAAGAALLALRAPFRPLLLALVLLGAFTLYDYVAVARNYGLGVLLLYAIAASWTRHRDTPGVLAALLFLLANANIHSVVFAGALLLLWAVELLQQRAHALPGSCPPGRSAPAPASAPAPDRRAWRSFALAVGATALGAALCLWQAYPSAQSAAMLPTERPGPLALVTTLVLGLGPAFAELMPVPLRTPMPVLVILPALIGLAIAGLRTPPARGEPPHRWARDPALGTILAAIAALVGMTLVFVLVYPGGYRHQALLLAFLVTLAWIVAARAPDRRAPDNLALITLLALQLVTSALVFARIAHGVPESRSRDLAALLARPALADAIVVGDPDTALEALPYYTRHPIYLARERRFGTTLAFSKAAQETMTLGRLLDAAHRLQARHRRPIVVVLGERLGPGTTAGLRDRGYYGTLRVDLAEARRFLAATRRLARFAPAATDESYDVYLLKPPASLD